MPGGEFWQFLGESLGANPTPVAYAELYTALQAGTVDGQDNPLVAGRTMKFYEGHHDLSLEKGGMTIYPRLVASDHHSEFDQEHFPSSIKELDLLLGGGLDRGTSNMFMGPPGTGKSTMAVKFALEAATRGERVLMFLFDETLQTLTTRARTLGMDLTPYIEKGIVTIEQQGNRVLSLETFDDLVTPKLQQAVMPAAPSALVPRQ